MATVTASCRTKSGKNFKHCEETGGKLNAEEIKVKNGSGEA